MGLADSIKKASDVEVTQKAVEAKAAHILALEKGLAVYKKQRLNMVVLKDGSKVKPTDEGFFIGINPEITAQLKYFAENFWGYVEKVEA